ncbi:hypothetical protein BP6252_06922 [Coleophoma cylindrospora]|uniref:G-protein coupled receptors family 1 profile domain-containing protein n=1 Tax=Coleophoma cylindrospora TaxID=1849047 RepID=A0A3D8RG39_9HELO|nr:hypothetical protein BP6252_06922 [Coleophoma cylindrospora]
MYALLSQRGLEPAPVPRVGLVVTSALSIISMSVLAICLSRRLNSLKNWRCMTVTHWLLLAIYIDSMLFVSITAILSHGFGLNTSIQTCSAAILLCLVCYMSTKLIYYFLVEKANIVNDVNKKRFQSKLYLFNCFGMLVPYCIVVVLNFVYRIATINESGTCIIGMEKKAMMPLIIFDVVVNIYLTSLFIIPLRRQMTYSSTSENALRTVTFRTFIGSLTTLTSSVINLTILMVLHGEPAWICLMCCNFDILFSVLVLHWVTTKDSTTKFGSKNSNNTRETQMCHFCQGRKLSDFHRSRVFDGTTSKDGEKSVVTNVTTAPYASTDKIVEVDVADVKSEDCASARTRHTISVQTDISWKRNINV